MFTLYFDPSQISHWIFEFIQIDLRKYTEENESIPVDCYQSLATLKFFRFISEFSIHDCHQLNYVPQISCAGAIIKQFGIWLLLYIVPKPADVALC